VKANFSAKLGQLLGGFPVLLVLLGIAGCSPGNGTVSGKVYFQKKLVRGGTVLFYSPEGNGSRSATIGEDGSYTIADMPPGKVKISVETESAKPSTSSSHVRKPPKDTQLPPEAAGNSIYDKSAASTVNRYTRIPAAYGNYEQSGLTFEVTGGNNTYDIKLE